MVAAQVKKFAFFRATDFLLIAVSNAVTCWDHDCQPSTGDIPTEVLLELLI